MVKKAVFGAIATTALASFAAQAAPMSRVPVDSATWECGPIQVNPPDRDRDPGFKINLVITPDSFSATHTTVSGATYVRDEQYRDIRIWNDGKINWTGRSLKYPQLTMVGTFGQSPTTRRMEYVEKVYKAGKLETVIASTCHYVPNGPPAPEVNLPARPPVVVTAPPQPSLPPPAPPAAAPPAAAERAQGQSGQTLTADCRTALATQWAGANYVPDHPTVQSNAARMATLLMDRKMQDIAREVAQPLRDETIGPAEVANPNMAQQQLAGKFHRGLLSRVRAVYSVPPYNNSPEANVVLGLGPRHFVSCFPDFRDALQDFTRRLKVAVDAAAEEAKRQQKEREDEANKPTTVLANAYKAYIVIKRCYEARRGYVAVHVSEPEMAHAKDAIQLIEKRLAPQLPSDTSVEQLWARADQDVQQRFGGLLAYASELRVGEGLCLQHKMQLSQMLRKLSPEASETRKDF